MDCWLFDWEPVISLTRSVYDLDPVRSFDSDLDLQVLDDGIGELVQLRDRDLMTPVQVRTSMFIFLYIASDSIACDQGKCRAWFVWKRIKRG